MVVTGGWNNGGNIGISLNYLNRSFKLWEFHSQRLYHVLIFSKFEARNPKSETISNDPNSNNLNMPSTQFFDPGLGH